MSGTAKSPNASETRVRSIKEAELMPVYLQAMAEKGSVTIPVSGTSMNPFLGHLRDTVTLEPVKGPVKKGDIVLYVRESGGLVKYIMHRVVGKKDGAYVLCGDAQVKREFGVAPDSVKAVVRSARRKGKSIDEHSPVWRFYAVAWRLLRPARGLIFRAASLFKRK